MGGVEPQGITRMGKQFEPGRRRLRYGTCLPALGNGLIKGTGLCQHFCLGESCPPALALMPDTSVPPCIFLLLSCCYRAGAQREWVLVSLCGGPLRGTAWDSRSLHLTRPQSPLVFTADAMGTSPGSGALGWGPGVGLGPLAPQR